jgi:DNA-binding transcriptional regulator YiaG
MSYTHTTKVGRFTVTDGGLSAPARTLNDGTQVLSYEQVAEFERRAAITVLRDIELVQGEELKFARKALDMSQPELAEYLGVAEATVSKWENNREAFKRPVQLALLGLLEAVNHGAILCPPKHPSTEQDFHLRVA